MQRAAGRSAATTHGGPTWPGAGTRRALTDRSKRPVAEGAGRDGVAERFEREMGFSHAEFRRALERTYAGPDLSMREDGADIRHAGGWVRIRLGPEGVRRIALLELPVTTISFTFEGVSAAQRAAFMQHFELYFRRGGG